MRVCVRKSLPLVPAVSYSVIVKRCFLNIVGSFLESKILISSTLDNFPPIASMEEKSNSFFQGELKGLAIDWYFPNSFLQYSAGIDPLALSWCHTKMHQKQIFRPVFLSRFWCNSLARQWGNLPPPQHSLQKSLR